MFSLVLNVVRWIFRRLTWLLAIVAVLWAGWLVQSQLKALTDLVGTVEYLKNGQSKLRNDFRELAVQAGQSVAKLKSATVIQLDQRINFLTKQIESNNQRLDELDGILTKLNPAKHLDVAKLKIEIEIASRELDHLRYLREVSAKSSRVGGLAVDCENIRLQHVAVWNNYEAAKARLDSFNASGNLNSQWNPLSEEFKTRKALESGYKELVAKTQYLKSQYDQCLSSLVEAKRVLAGFDRAKEFALNNQKIEPILSELGGQIAAIQDQVDKHWLKPILLDPLKQILPIAVTILAGAIVVPITIKLVLYFLLAPIAGRQTPICLDPTSDRENPRSLTDSKSAVSISLDVPSDSELLVQPSYFHSAPERCEISSKFVLDSRFVMTSLAAGMYNLTAVRSEEPFSAALSAGQESLSELLRFDIGEGQSVCIRPRNLVGVIQRRSAPVRISSHWRLFSLQAWLTLQLRYLVFHGPASIIVKGCRGVRVELAEGGKAIEQACTVGFSANLNYSTTRTETFMAYFGGKKELLRDRFSGQSGYFIYEAMPDPSKRVGITGRGIEGIADAVLKLFGI